MRSEPDPIHSPAEVRVSVIVLLLALSWAVVAVRVLVRVAFVVCEFAMWSLTGIWC